MIELPEAHTLANQIAHHLSGKMASSTTAAQSPHKFAWYHEVYADYPANLKIGSILSIRGLGIFVEIMLSTCTLLSNNGDNLRPSSDSTI